MAGGLIGHYNYNFAPIWSQRKPGQLTALLLVRRGQTVRTAQPALLRLLVLLLVSDKLPLGGQVLWTVLLALQGRLHSSCGSVYLVYDANS